MTVLKATNVNLKRFLTKFQKVNKWNVGLKYREYFKSSNIHWKINGMTIQVIKTFEKKNQEKWKILTTEKTSTKFTP